MIIQVAGTSGSGKSTVVRALLAHLEDTRPVYMEGRRAPLGYVGQLEGSDRPVFVVGAYEAPTGGCDTIKDVALVVGTVMDAHVRGEHVVFEGLFVMNHTRGPAMARAVGVNRMRIILLDVSLAECFERINARRAEQGRGPLLNHHNTEGNYVRARNYARKMEAMGVRIHRLPTQHALPLVKEILTSCPSQ